MICVKRRGKGAAGPNDLEALKAIEPSETMCGLVKAMLAAARDQQGQIAKATVQAARTNFTETERKIATPMDRVMEASQPSVIVAVQGKIATLEREKFLLAEKIEAGAKPFRRFEDMFEFSMRFLLSL